MLLSTKLNPQSYLETAETDYYPYSRRLFSGGLTSVGNLALGYLSTQYPIIHPLFAALEYYRYEPYGSTITDVEEYSAGFILGSYLGNKSQVRNDGVLYFFREQLSDALPVL